MAPPRKQTLPAPLPGGFLLTDTEKKRWRLGKIIGQGGFGLIYLASKDLDNPVAQDSDFVIKVEYHENGPLFSELKFYQRAAKPESMQKWKTKNKLDFLGIPAYWGSGLAEHNGTRYRFMVMDRLGSDLQKLCDENGGQLKKDTVMQLGCILLDVLEYVHDNEYVHADIKAANLMLGHRDPDKVYLADYGLSYRYCPDGVHKEYKENPKKGHNGTIEYTNVDAHNGVAPSRRGDLQVLGFCMLHWLCGTLPWDSVLKNPTQVHEAKSRLMDKLPGSVQHIVSGATTDEVAQFLIHVKMLGPHYRKYKQRPDYQKLRELLWAGRSRACGGHGRLDLSGTHGERAGGSTIRGSARAKKGGQTQGLLKHKPVAMEVKESEEMEIEFEEEEKGKSKPVPACYIRGPPISRPQPEKQPSRARAPARVSKPDPVPVSSEGEEDEEEERPRPIAACYIRGPPIGPRPQPEQGKSRTKTSNPDDFDLTVTSSRPKVNDRKSCYQRGRVLPINRDRLIEQDDCSEIRGRMQMGCSSQTRSGHWNEPSYDWEHYDHKCDDQWSGNHQRYYSHSDDDIWEYPTSRYRDGNWEEHVKTYNNQKEKSVHKQEGIWAAKLYGGCIFVLLFLILVLFAM